MRVTTDAFIDALEAGGISVGDAVGSGLTAPYVVAFPLLALRDGSLEDPFSDVDQWYQATGYGTTREQAEWVIEKAEPLIRAAFVVTELQTLEIVREDATGAPPMYRAPLRARIRSHA